MSENWIDVMDALDRYNVFIPAGSGKFGDTERLAGQQEKVSQIFDERIALGRRLAARSWALVAAWSTCSPCWGLWALISISE